MLKSKALSIICLSGLALFSPQGRTQVPGAAGFSSSDLRLSFRAKDGSHKDCREVDLERASELHFFRGEMKLRAGNRVINLLPTVIEGQAALSGSLGMMPLKTNDSRFYSKVTFYIEDAETLGGRLTWHQVQLLERKGKEELRQSFCEAEFRTRSLGSEDLLRGLLGFIGAVEAVH